METKYLTVSSKNQITLNKEVRNILNIQSGDKVYFENSSNGVLFKKLENIEPCPICNGGRVFNNNKGLKCLICDGDGVIKEELNSEFIIGKLFHILLCNSTSIESIDIKKDEQFGYIIKTKSSNDIVSKYIEECQKLIIKYSLQHFIDDEVLIDLPLKNKCVELFKDIIDEDEILNLINNIQLDVIKTLLKQKVSITKEEYEIFIVAFDEEYRDKVSRFLLPFVNLEL